MKIAGWWFIAIITGILTWLIVGSIPNALGNYGFWAMLFVLIVGPIAGFFAGLFILIEFQKKEKQRSQKEKQRMWEEEQLMREEEQRRIDIRSLNNYLLTSNNIANSLPQLLQDAEHDLDLAETEFKEGAFDPFWDAIERSVNILAKFETNIQEIIKYSESYKREALKLDTTPQPFELENKVIPDASITYQRMHALVRRAQKDPDFTFIYHQRITNRSLIEGFSNLGHAISELGNRIESSQNQLLSSISVQFSKLSSVQEETFNSLNDKLESDTDVRQEHEHRQDEVLDDIQRRLKNS